MDNDTRKAVTGETTSLREEIHEDDDILQAHPSNNFLWFLVGLIALMLLGYLAYRFLFRTVGDVPQSGVIQVVATPTPHPVNEAESFWASRNDWLTPADYPALRTSSEVYNLAYLNDGTVRYSSKSISAKNSAWKPAKRPEIISQTSLTGSNLAVWISYRDNWYILNVYQPFVLADQPDTVYLVTQNGRFWSINNISEDDLVSEPDVELSSPVQVPANSQLTL